MGLERRTPLVRRTPLKARTPLRRSQLQPRKYRQKKWKPDEQELDRRARRWCKRTGPRRCQKCGEKFGPNYLQVHHILTVGAHIELQWCWENLIRLCRDCHRFAHAKLGEFREWLETVRPGLLDRLYGLSLEWRNKPLEEKAAHLESAPIYSDVWPDVA